ncbi:hsp70 family protein [Anaeramoeba flamelloides]|uniref:Hsp70 family protein n=1 Tax=Anaeramoeba flamelloides TaxID=1746091 RepID=A0AAV7YTP8_9EUKA|nr:hsp70 family protein [Anaeramoeba flamelloides]
MDQIKVIVTIDFGTSNTGFGFSFVDPNNPDKTPDPLKIYGNEKWDDYKTNTAILFQRKNQKLHKPIAFGQTAIRKYLNGGNLKKQEHELFRYFKMNLYDNEKYVKSESGKLFNLYTVIQGVLIWMKSQSIKYINQQLAIFHRQLKEEEKKKKKKKKKPQKRNRRKKRNKRKKKKKKKSVSSRSTSSPSSSSSSSYVSNSGSESSSNSSSYSSSSSSSVSSDNSNLNFSSSLSHFSQSSIEDLDFDQDSDSVSVSNNKNNQEKKTNQNKTKTTTNTDSNTENNNNTNTNTNTTTKNEKNTNTITNTKNEENTDTKNNTTTNINSNTDTNNNTNTDTNTNTNIDQKNEEKSNTNTNTKNEENKNTKTKTNTNTRKSNKKLLLDKQFIKKLKKITINNIKWVLTIPAIWSERSKYQMRKAAYQAKLIKTLNSDQLLFALEPEAAAIHNYYGLKKSERFNEPKCLIVDAGGGTIDITALKISTDLNMENQLEVLIAPKGGDFGANYVDREFQKFLVEFFLNDENFLINDKHGYQSMLVEWEEIKKNVTLEFRGDIHRKQRINVAPKLIPNKSNLKKLIEIYNQKSKYKIEICGKSNINITRDHLFSFFEPSINQITKHLNFLFENYDQLKDCKHIIMVGGYSKSMALVNSIKSKFEKIGKTVTTSKNPGRHVIMGAVRYGFQPNIIRWRRLNFTYGLKISQVFKSEVHDEERKRKPKNSKAFIVDNVFKPFVFRNVRIEHTDKFLQNFTVLIEKHTQLAIEIFKTQSDLIQNKIYYLDQVKYNFKRVGKVVVKFPKMKHKKIKRKKKNKKRKNKKKDLFKIILEIEFGRSEFTILVKEQKTLKIMESARIQFSDQN